ncbi:hypothetical protein [Streptomyces lavendulocolor]
MLYGGGAFLGCMTLCVTVLGTLGLLGAGAGAPRAEGGRLNGTGG